MLTSETLIFSVHTGCGTRSYDPSPPTVFSLYVLHTAEKTDQIYRCMCTAALWQRLLLLFQLIKS